VTVGTIDAGGRLETVAIGAAVNLAARLCARAGAGQILVDERTVELVGAGRDRRLERLEAAELKGFARPVSIFQAIGG
jgi:adenylate cyclase